jgi:hypothetical protein
MPKLCSIWLMTLGTLASGQTAAPSFRADRVLFGGSDRVKPLAPGMDFSIYGKELGRARQINFRVPEGAPLEGTAELRVQSQNRSSAAVTVPFGVENRNSRWKASPA